VPVRSLFGLKTVSGFSLRGFQAAAADQAHADIAELGGLLAKGEVRAAAETRLPLTGIAEAHRLLEARAVLGRILLTP